MKIQISTDYAIRILQYLHQQREELHTATHIAESVGITYPFFIKIASQLKKNNLLTSVQGRNGGYQLGKPADEISLYDVFLCVEGEMRISKCLGGQPCTKGAHENCALHSFFCVLQKGLIDEMSGHTIRDLAN